MASGLLHQNALKINVFFFIFDVRLKENLFVFLILVWHYEHQTCTPKYTWTFSHIHPFILLR